jgi:UDP-N-acetyl-D-galactosamine dehydrogenase
MVQKPDELKNLVIAVIGLGYVGLPIALAFGRTDKKTYGFDINSKRIEALNRSVDETSEVSKEEIKNSNVTFTDDEKDIGRANFIIVAVPTPITKANQPDLSLLESASQIVGRFLKRGTIVVFESTVYPGVTEEFCAPILESSSGLERGRDFLVGYSPERINPGDKEHTLEKIVKVVSGENPEVTQIIADTYELVCQAGTFKAASIKTAEAAKVIENTQRDLNIALVNELSLIFHRLGLDTHEVLEAAGTKWNFLKFQPGLVGGHCIGVDPYYLVHKAEEIGYHPHVIIAGRRVNDYMPEFIAEETIKGLIEAGKNIQKSKILVLGLTFKENVKDIRNSKIAVTIKKLQSLGLDVVAYDPLVSKGDALHEFSIELIPKLEGTFDAIIVATGHRAIKEQREKILAVANKKTVFFDARNCFPELKQDKRLIYKNL